jgi:hypothetical protein
MWFILYVCNRLNALANLYVGILMITLQPPEAPISTGAAWAYSVMFVLLFLSVIVCVMP